MHPLFNYECVDIDENISRVKFDIFDIVSEPSTKPIHIDDIKLLKKYYFCEEKFGYECSQTFKNTNIITTENTAGDYISCLKLEKL